jgi:hypothetical protein
VSDIFDRSDCFDRAGNPISFPRWGELFHDREYQIVQQDRVAGYFVSTVWLGIDHGWGWSERPLIFETMVFHDDGSGDDLECRRYSSEAEARAGHVELVEQVSLIAAASDV